MTNILKNIITFFVSKRKNYGFTEKNVLQKFPKEQWSKEKLFSYNLVKNKMNEPDEDYINKDIGKYQNIIINEELNHWDLIKICALNGEKLQINKGWYSLLKNYFIELEKIGWNKRLSCVKEKYAELRVYFSKETTFKEYELLEHITKKYEEASKFTCETCGKFGRIRYNGWDYVACREHYHIGQSSIHCDENYLTTDKCKNLWDNLQAINTEYDNYGQPSFITLNFKDNNQQNHLSTSFYGFGKLVPQIPKKVRHLFKPVIFEKYSYGAYCKVCGLKSFFNHKCEACEFSEYLYLTESKEFKYSNEDIKYYQLEWFKDEAELFYTNNKLYEMNPDYKRLFSKDELNQYIIETDNDENAENIYKDCNKKH